MSKAAEWLEKIPQRITCPQDEIDVFAAFEEEANMWVYNRTPSGSSFRPTGHKFYPSNSSLIIHKWDIAALSAISGEDETRYIPFQSALNRLSNQKNELKYRDEEIAKLRGALETVLKMVGILGAVSNEEVKAVTSAVWDVLRREENK